MRQTPRAYRQHLPWRALAAVAAAVEGDFDDARLLTTDPDLDVLHQEPDFQSRVERVKRR
jgi:hypothetical protein